MWLLFLACSDYNFNKTSPVSPSEDIEEPVSEEEVPVPQFPELRADPLSIDQQGICGSMVFDVSLWNDGDAPVIVESLDLLAPGWSINEESLPFSIQPSTMKSIWLTASSGQGQLVIQSNDHDNPQIIIDLFAEADQPPELTMTTPHEGMVVPVGGELFTAVVTDVEDPNEEILVEWHSDIDGLLSTDPPASDGSLQIDFVNHSPGAHQLSLVAYDSCGNESSTTVNICQQHGYDVENLDISTWNFEGTALWDSGNSWVELTGPYTNQAGTAFSTAATVNAQNVEIEFLFYVSGGSGADGISLTALDTTRMSGFVGSSGGGIGYAGMPGWSIEVDTYHNSPDPTSDDHLAFVFDGDVNSSMVWASLPEMEDGQWHSMKIQVSDPHVMVEIDGVTYIDQDIHGHYNFPAYVGFTAATGSLTNYHLIDSLMVTEMVCE